MNLIADLLPALALVRDRDLGTPNLPAGHLADRRLAGTVAKDSTVIAAATLASYIWGLRRYGAGMHASTLAFTTITLSEIAYALACRPKGKPMDPGLAAALGLAGSAQIATVVVPSLRGVLRTTPLAGLDWLVAVSCSLGTLGMTQLVSRRVELRKAHSKDFVETQLGL